MGETAVPPDDWQRTPRWAFWRPKWYRKVYRGWDWHAGWDLQFATDEQLARHFLEDTYGQT